MYTYDELKELFETPNNNYYELLLTHADIILRAYRTRNQTQLGLELGLNQTQVSLLLKLLTAYSDLNLKS